MHILRSCDVSHGSRYFRRALITERASEGAHVQVAMQLFTMREGGKI